MQAYIVSKTLKPLIIRLTQLNIPEALFQPVRKSSFRR